MVRALALGAALLAAVASPPGAVAQEGAPANRIVVASSPEALEKQREALFARMVAEPANLDVAFEYALLSIQMNDLEAAVSTLERMLIFAPGLARVQLELGVLYFRLGSYDSARAYLEAAISGDDVPADVRDRVKLYLEQLKVLIEPPPVSGALYSALRWQSNANTGAGSRTVNLGGFQFVLDDEATGQADWSVLNVGTVRLIHDLKRQGDTIEANLLAYSARYFEQEQVNLEFVQALVGPSFNLRRVGMDKSRLHLYAIADFARLQDQHYFSSFGAGAKLVSHAAERSTLEIKAEVRDRTYNDTRKRPTSSLRDGTVSTVSAYYAYQLTPTVVASLQSYIMREALEATFFSNFEFAHSVGLAKTFESPLKKHKAFQEPWLLQLIGGYTDRRFDDPDPTINPFAREKDEIYWGRATLVVPVGEHWALIPQVEYRDQQSNYEIRAFDNLTAMVGAQRRF